MYTAPTIAANYFSYIIETSCTNSFECILWDEMNEFQIKDERRSMDQADKEIWEFSRYFTFINYFMILNEEVEVFSIYFAGKLHCTDFSNEYFFQLIQYYTIYILIYFCTWVNPPFRLVNSFNFYFIIKHFLPKINFYNFCFVVAFQTVE